MSFVTTRHGDLLVAAHAADERSIQRALKQLDDRLVLALNPQPERSGYVWQVMCVYSDSQPAETVLTWPYPLSSMLIEEVKRLREVDTFKLAEDHNRQLRERDEKASFDETLATVEDALPYVTGRRRHYGVFRRQQPRRLKHLSEREVDEQRRAREEAA